MDFRQKNSVNTGHHMPTMGTMTSPSPSKQNKQKWQKFVRLSSIVLLFSGTILLVAVLLSIALGSNDTFSERRLVDKESYQSVYLVNGTETYIGKVVSMTNDYINLRDVFLLTPTQLSDEQADIENTPQFSLTKLGCQIVGPQDQLIINKDQVLVWLNLKNDGKVVQGIEQFKRDNPNGVDCDAAAPVNAENTTPQQTETPAQPQQPTQEQPATPQNNQQ